MLVASGRVALLALGASVTGCIATSTRMISPSLPIPAIAPPNAALVVFVRPSQYKASIATTILEDNGVFMGDSIGGSEFFVTLPPGPHLFLAWAENTAPLRATLLPGRVYYVEVAPHFGFLSPRVQLLAITPRSEKWAELSAWISESQQLVPNLALGQAYLNDRSEDVAKRIRSAHENLSALDPDELAARTLYPEDGVPSPPPLLVPLAPAPVSAPPPPAVLPPAPPPPAPPQPAPPQPAQ